MRQNPLLALNAHHDLDEVGGVIVELEKQVKELQAGIAGQKGAPRPILKLG